MTRRRQPVAIAPPSCSRYSLYRAAVCYITLRYETHYRYYSALQITKRLIQVFHVNQYIKQTFNVILIHLRNSLNVPALLK